MINQLQSYNDTKQISQLTHINLLTLVVTILYGELSHLELRELPNNSSSCLAVSSAANGVDSLLDGSGADVGLCGRAAAAASGVDVESSSPTLDFGVRVIELTVDADPAVNTGNEPRPHILTRNQTKFGVGCLMIYNQLESELLSPANNTKAKVN